MGRKPGVERAQRLGAQHAHEASEHDHVGRDLLESGGETHVPRRAVRMPRGRHQEHGDALLHGPVERRADPVGEDADDAPPEYPALLRRPQPPRRS